MMVPAEIKRMMNERPQSMTLRMIEASLTTIGGHGPAWSVLLWLDMVEWVLDHTT